MQLQRWNRQPDNDIQGSGTASVNGHFACSMLQIDLEL